MLNRKLLSQTLISDINHIINIENIPWERLKNTSVFITGATGTLGSYLSLVLTAADERYGLNLRVLSSGRNQYTAAQLLMPHGIEFIQSDICKSLNLPCSVDYIIHCAATTDSSKMANAPVQVIETLVNGTQNVLKLAEKDKVKSIVYLSSMEVYGVLPSGSASVKENELGHIDLFNSRSSYSESKRLCELMCYCYYKQFTTPVKIARLALSFGAGSRKDDPRVFAQFARSAMARTNITLHTEGRSQGNYCYLADSVSAILYLLLKGANGEAYNVSNPAASITIREMALLVANEVAAGQISVVINNNHKNIKTLGYAPETGLWLNADKLIDLGWHAEYGLADMYRRMIADWTNN